MVMVPGKYQLDNLLKKKKKKKKKKNFKNIYFK